MNFDFGILSRQLAPMINIMKELKDDKIVTNAKHTETNKKVDEKVGDVLIKHKIDV